MDRIKRLRGKFLAFTLSLMVMCSMLSLPVFAGGTTTHIATEWSQVQGLIDNATESDIVDITELRLTKADTTLSISKNITIKCEPTNEAFYDIFIKNLYFDIQNDATLTLENIAIENTVLDKSMISGTGNAVISKSMLEPSTANGTTTVYDAPATIDLMGDVLVMTDTDLFSCSVAGATILQRDSGNTGKAGTAIKAVNVTVNGGHVVGGASFESNCDSGDAIVASGDVTINNNAEIQAGSVGSSTTNTKVGLPIRFTEDADTQRVLSVQGARVFGSGRSSNGYAAPYTIKMSKKDIAIIDNSKIGWYTDIPVFSDGFFYITNPVATWGTLDNATEVYPLIATNGTLSGTKVITKGNDVSHFAPQNATITIQANAPVYGKQFKEWIVVSGGITPANSKSATTTFTMPESAVEVTATYEDIPPHIHTPSDTWSKDDMSHWHECSCGEKIDERAHTWNEGIVITPPTCQFNGVKQYTCTICGKTKKETIPMLEHDYGTEWKTDVNNHWYECKNCGEKKDIEAHTFDEWVIDSPATETIKGSKHRACNVCAYRETIEIPMLTITPEYHYIEGANSQWTVNSNTDITVKVNGDFTKFTGVKVNGTVIDASNYTAKSGSTVITLKPEYLNTLKAGTYNLAVVYTDGEADTTFTIKGAVKPNNPVKPDTGQTNIISKDTSSLQTGDITNIALLMSLFIVSSGTLVFVFKKRKKAMKD